MQAFHLSAQGITPLRLPVLHRSGPVDAEPYRRQARGEDPKPDQKLIPSAGLRSIVLAPGPAGMFFAAPGRTLNFVISGTLMVRAAGECRLLPGDMLLCESDAEMTAGDECRILQIGVPARWPGEDAEIQPPGAITPRAGPAKYLRMFEGPDHRSYFRSFAALFPAERNCWSELRPVLGFRFLCFRDPGFIDWHPEVVNNLAIFLSGEMELEVGGSGAIEIFRAGDVVLSEDRTGEGHIDRSRGDTHLALIVLATEDLWPADCRA